MKRVLVATFDSKGQIYTAPQMFRNVGEASRSFGDAVKREQALRDHAEDFSMVCVGEYDDEKGLLIPHAQPLSVASASSFLSPAS